MRINWANMPFDIYLFIDGSFPVENLRWISAIDEQMSSKIVLSSISSVSGKA